uniref:Unspecific monooxygenase n=1 Tax=Sphingobacterium sp. (strain 21) TaxID=743722 RepID=F4CE63_SPHS2
MDLLTDKNIPFGPKEASEVEEGPQALSNILNLFHQYGDIYKIYSERRNNYTYVISDPEMVKHVLITNNRNYEKGVGIDRVKILLGNGIMVSEGNYWKRQRRMIQPAFHKRVIAKLTDDIAQANETMLSNWLTGNKEINLTAELSSVTLRIVLQALFSVDFQQLEKREGVNPFALLTEVHERNLVFAMKFRALAKTIQEIINLRRKEHRVEEDFLSMIMEAKNDEGQGMSDREIIDEMMTLIVAGHETTASALTWAWYLLHKHPEVYARAKQEALQVQNVHLGFHHLEQLPYIRQVIEETMRLYPPGWLLTRRAMQDDVIGGYHVPPKTDIFISPYVIHRHPRYWEQPDLFNPERFDASYRRERHRFEYFPFSGGPRQCIGDFFALVEMQLHLALILRTTDMEILVDEPISMEAQINLRPDKPLFARLINPRN